MRLRKLKIAITGAGGFIGSHLIRSLSDEVECIISITGPEKNAQSLPNATVVDICDAKRLKKILRGADRVVHLAGLSSVRDSFKDPAECLKVNTSGTANLLDACKSLDIKEVIIISSAEVYGNPGINLVSEAASLTPLSPYGVSKVAIEQMCFVYHKAYDMNFKILRPFSIYGPGMSRKSVIYEIYNRMLVRNNIVLFNTSSVRDYCHVSDLITAIKKALFSKFRGFEVYNIGTGVGTNSKQLAELIQAILSKQGKISESKTSDRPKKSDINHLVASIVKAGEELTWKPDIRLAEGLTATIDSFRHE